MGGTSNTVRLRIDYSEGLEGPVEITDDLLRSNPIPPADSVISEGLSIGGDWETYDSSISRDLVDFQYRNLSAQETKTLLQGYVRETYLPYSDHWKTPFGILEYSDQIWDAARHPGLHATLQFFNDENALFTTPLENTTEIRRLSDGRVISQHTDPITGKVCITTSVVGSEGELIPTLIETNGHVHAYGMEQTSANELSILDQLAEMNYARNQAAASTGGVSGSDSGSGSGSSSTSDGGTTSGSGSTSEGSGDVVIVTDAADAPDGYSPDPSIPTSGGVAYVKEEVEEEENDNSYDAAHKSGTSGHGYAKPVILDLDGDGLQITELSNSAIFTDANNDGLGNRIAWAAAGNAVLFYDPDNTGEITEMRQFIFTEWDPTALSPTMGSIDAWNQDNAWFPVVLDLDGDGIDVSLASSVTFDVDGDGYREQTSWAAADDGLLVIDLAADGSISGTGGDGVIDQAAEVAFAGWAGAGATDLQALAEATDPDGDRIFDTNGDGVLDAGDEVWASMKVFQDLDQDGEVDDGELRTLDDWGISQINLGYDDGSGFAETDDDLTVLGNTLHGLASYVRDGELVEGGVGDVSLVYGTYGWRRVETADGYRRVVAGRVGKVIFEDERDFHFVSKTDGSFVRTGPLVQIVAKRKEEIEKAVA